MISPDFEQSAIFTAMPSIGKALWCLRGRAVSKARGLYWMLTLAMLELTSSATNPFNRHCIEVLTSWVSALPGCANQSPSLKLLSENDRTKPACASTIYSILVCLKCVINCLGLRYRLNLLFANATASARHGIHFQRAMFAANHPLMFSAVLLVP